LKKLPSPAWLIPTNYFASIDADLCDGCETCLERCSMDAITLNEGEIADINLERCIGCGLCVSTCPPEALSLERKAEDRIITPPESGVFMRPSKDLENSIRSE